MHWLLLVGGQACWVGGQKVHRLAIASCPDNRLGETIDESFTTIYGINQEYGPPLPEMKTWVLGFNLKQRRNIENKVMPVMKRRMDRLEVCVYDDFYEDEPQGKPTFNALSYEKCKACLENVTEFLIDSQDVDEEEIPLYAFSDRPEGFSKPKLPAFTGENAERWKYSTVASLQKHGDTARGNSKVLPKKPAGNVSNPAGAAKQRHAGAAVTAVANDGAGPSTQNFSLGLQMEDDCLDLQEEYEERKVAKIRAGLKYAGYPVAVIETMMNENLTLRSKKLEPGKSIQMSWSLRLPNTKFVRTFKEIRQNPYPGGKVIKNPPCEVAGCTRIFGHDGSCVIKESVVGTKRKPDNSELVAPSLQNKKSRGVASPSSPSKGAGPKPIFAKGSTTSVIVQCGKIEGIWSPSDPNVFKVTHGLLPREMPNKPINGNAFERLGGKGYCRNWRNSISVNLDNGRTMCMGTYMDRIKVSGKPQSSKVPYVEWAPEEIEAATAKKKESIRLMLAQSRYPTAIIEEILEKARFKADTSAEGKLVIKFFINLPSGSSASSAQGILMNPYSLGGGGISGGMCALQGPKYGRKKHKDDDQAVSGESDVDEEEEEEDEAAAAKINTDFVACTKTTGCDERDGHAGLCKTAPLQHTQHIKEEQTEVEKEKQQEPQDEFAIYLATTEEDEDFVEEEGEDYSSTFSEDMGDDDDGAGPSRLANPAQRQQDTNPALETAKKQKIAGIRASLQCKKSCSIIS